MSQIIASIIGSIGFSIVFGIRRAYMLPIAVNAGLSWAVYLLVNGFAGDFAAPAPSSAPAQAVAALVSLGYSPSDAAAAVARVDETLPVQEIIKVALRSLSRAR